MEETSFPVQYLAIGGRDEYGILPEQAIKLFEKLRGEVTLRWKDSIDEKNKKTLSDHAAILDRYEAVLLSINRIAASSGHIIPSDFRSLEPSRKSEKKGLYLMAAFAGAETMADFESLLFHSRALLDQLTLMVARVHGQESDRFSRLKNVLRDFAQKSTPAKELMGVLSSARGIQGILTDVEKRSLRSLVAHRSTISRGTTSVFAVHVIDDDEFLVFDCEAYGYGVLASTEILAQEVTYIGLNGIAIYLEVDDRLSQAECLPRWRNPAVRFSEWVDKTGRGPLFSTVARMHPDGFVLRTEHLRPEVLRHVVPRHDIDQPGPRT